MKWMLETKDNQVSGDCEDVFEKVKEAYLQEKYWSSFTINKFKVLRSGVNKDGSFGRYEEVCDLILG